MLILLSCAPEPIPQPPETTGKTPSSDYVDGDRQVALFEAVVYGEFVGETRPRLYILDGRRTPDGYEATRLVEGKLESGLFSDAWVAGESCTGGFTLAGDVLEIRTSGPGACASLAGTYTDLEVVRERERAAKEEKVAAAQGASGGTGTACERYRDCLCELDATWAIRGQGDNPFQKGCADAKRLVVTAPDDVEGCTSARELISRMAGALGAVPAACTTPNP